MDRKKKILLMVGQMCKKHREKQGLTQRQIAEETGYSEQNISSFETGRTNNLVLFLWYLDDGLMDMGNRIILRQLLRR